MKYIILSLLFFTFFVIQLQGNIRINSYNISIEITPENKSIKAQADIKLSVDPESLDSLVFYLHKEFSVVEIKSNVPISYIFRTDERSAYFWMKDACPLWIKLENNNKENIDIQFVYHGPIRDLDWNTTNMISESWIELGGYSAWFPINPDYGKFIYNINLGIDQSYKVTGMVKY